MILAGGEPRFKQLPVMRITVPFAELNHGVVVCLMVIVLLESSEVLVVSIESELKVRQDKCMKGERLMRSCAIFTCQYRERNISFGQCFFWVPPATEHVKTKWL